MDLLHVVALALVQGLTEFLPISSSAHLILVPVVLGWPDQGLAFDVAVHLGTLAAVVYYFRHAIATLVVDWLASLRRRQSVGESRLAWAVIGATLPAVVFGLVFKEAVETTLRGPLVIATTTIVFGLLLGWADIKGARQRSEHQLGLRDVLVIGFAQALALIPGTSRSGITITAGLFLGLKRQAAARFSFLLSIPTILGAGLLKTKDLLEQTQAVDWQAIIMGATVSALGAYACIHLFLKLLDRMGMMPFVAYRLILGGMLLWLFL